MLSANSQHNVPGSQNQLRARCIAQIFYDCNFVPSVFFFSPLAWFISRASAPFPRACNSIQDSGTWKSSKNSFRCSTEMNFHLSFNYASRTTLYLILAVLFHIITDVYSRLRSKLSARGDAWSAEITGAIYGRALTLSFRFAGTPFTT